MRIGGPSIAGSALAALALSAAMMPAADSYGGYPSQRARPERKAKRRTYTRYRRGRLARVRCTYKGSSLAKRRSRRGGSHAA